MAATDSDVLTIDTRKRADQVRDCIIHLIRSRGLKPGDKLPTERELMDLLNVGRSSVRDALNSLGGLGIVEARPGLGLFLGRASVENVTRAVSGALHLETQVSWQLVEARSVVEIAASRLAAKRHTAEDVQRMEGALHRLRVGLEANDVDAVVAADFDFHLAMVQASHNQVLVETLRSIQPWLLQQRKELYDLQIQRNAFNYNAAVGTHEVILRPIVAGDPDQAEAEVRYHMEPAWQQVEIWPLD